MVVVRRPWVIAALAGVLAGAAAASGPVFEPVRWSRLEMGASKLLLSATTTVTAENVPAARAARDLDFPPEGTPVLARGPVVTVLTIESALPFGRRERTTVWLDPKDGTSLQRSKLVSGRKQYWKVYRYTKEGYYQWRVSPASPREEALPPEHWTNRSGHLVAASPQLPRGAVISDSYALLYLASAGRLERHGGRMKMMILAEEQPLELSFESDGSVQMAIDLREHGSDGVRHRREMVVARRVRVTARTLEALSRPGLVDLGFLGMRGELQMFIEIATGLPIRIVGRTSKVGELTVDLRGVEWAVRPSAEDVHFPVQGR